MFTKQLTAFITSAIVSSLAIFGIAPDTTVEQAVSILVIAVATFAATKLARDSK